MYFDKLTKAYPRHEGAAVSMVDENRNAIDLWNVDVLTRKALVSVCFMFLPRNLMVQETVRLP